MTESLLTPERAAQLLAVSLKTIRDWLKRGRLKGVRAGRLWRIPERDLETFLAAEKETQSWLDGPFPQAHSTQDSNRFNRVLEFDSEAGQD